MVVSALSMMPGHSDRRDLRGGGGGHVGTVPGGRTICHRLDLSSIIVRLPCRPRQRSRATRWGRTASWPSEERSRDLDLELELMRRLDPEQAEHINQAAEAVK